MSEVKGISVPDHALLRYMEKVEGRDLGALRNEIRDRVRRGMEAGARHVVVDGFTFVLNPAERVVVTVMSHGRTARRSPRDFREPEDKE